jgi:hypothetical protein
VKRNDYGGVDFDGMQEVDFPGWISFAGKRHGREAVEHSEVTDIFRGRGEDVASVCSSDWWLGPARH